MIKTVTTVAGKNTVTFPEFNRYFWVRNIGTTSVFISTSSDIAANADDTVTINAGDVVRLDNSDDDNIYVIGAGMLEIHANDIVDCPFKIAPVSGGGEIVNNESSYTLTNAADYPIIGLNMYGKSTQDGVPSPDNPVDIVSVGDSGSVTITVDSGDKSTTASITSALPLCGIPVDSGGNYTDSNGRQWICDELIYNADGTGKIVKNIRKYTFTGDETFSGYSPKTGTFLAQCGEKLINAKIVSNVEVPNIICSHLDRLPADIQYVNIEMKSSISIDKKGIVYFNIVGLSSAAEYKSKFKEFYDCGHPLTVIYELFEPQEIELTATEISALRELQTFNGITNISNDGGADMDIYYCTNKMLSEYVMPITTSLQSQIDELKAAVLSLGGNV